MSTVLGDSEVLMGRHKVSLVHRSEIGVDRLERVRDERAAALALSAAGTLPSVLQDPERDATDIATTGLDDLVSSPVVFGSVGVRSTLPEVEDARTFHPDVYTRPIKTVRGSRVSYKATTPRVVAGRFAMSGLQFKSSAHVIICVRRHARRAAILASGRGGSHHKDPEKKENSDVRC